MTVPPIANKRLRGAVRKFNPGTLQSDAEIIEQFVVRRHELDSVLGSLRGNIDSPSCEHVLVVAPRGRGKTMLFARAAAELRTNEEYSQSLLPVRFMEESLEIFNLADFWLETLFHLAAEIAATHPALARELRDTQHDLSARWREQLLHYHARLAVLDAADRLGRRLVLMVENLQSLTRAVDRDFGWQLRATLQCEPQIMLLASATTRFDALDDAAEPFFEQFRIISLGPLGTADCRRLWQAVTGNRIPERRVRPLEILTGGNPRLLVIVAGIAGHRSFRRLMEELVALIDEHTEYFRSQLEALPRSERRIYAAVLDLWAPSNTGEIAARARMNVRVASTMLARLAKRGALLVDATTGPRKRLYAASEPLYSIYYKLRRERDEAGVVERLIRFMVAFYDPSAMFQVFDRLPSEARHSAAMHAGINRAPAARLRDDISSREKWGRVEDGSSRVTGYRRIEARNRLREETGAAIRDGAWKRVLELVQQYVDAGWTRKAGVEGEHDSAYFSDGVAVAFQARGIAQGQLGDFEGEIASYREMIDLLDGDDRAVTRADVASTLASMGLRQAEIGSSEDALDACEKLERCLAALPGASRRKRPLEWRARCVRAMALMARKETKPALGVFRSVCRAFLSDDTPLDHWIIRTVLNLIALGAPEKDILDALASDKKTARTLAPLIAALRQRTGETVRAPAEVLEVAADFRKRIEETAAKGIVTG